jgi:hypothetical protein
LNDKARPDIRGGHFGWAIRTSLFRSFSPTLMTMTLASFSSGYMLVPTGVVPPGAIEKNKRGTTV